MASHKRRHKRASERLLKSLQANFDKLSGAYISDFLSLSAQGKGEDDRELVNAFEHGDDTWRKSTSILMAKNPGIIVDSRKERVLGRFTDFVTKLHKRHKDSLVDFSVEGLGIEKTQENLAKVGVKTQAKTVSGLQKKVDSLSISQLKEYKLLATD